MKEGMRQIVKGGGWVLCLSAVILLASIGVTSAQTKVRDPNDPNKPATRQRKVDPNAQVDAQPLIQKPLMVQGRRNAFNLMIASLQNLADATEVVLLQRGDAKDDETLIMKVELEVLRNHIQRLEQELANMEARIKAAETGIVPPRVKDPNQVVKPQARVPDSNQPVKPRTRTER